jgi:asparagine synthase (glutamine-hydrolysing)
LTGDGGDEAFGGYRRYAYWGMLHRIFPRIYTAIATRWYLPPARLFPLLNPAFAARVRAGAMPQEQFSAMDGMLAYAFTTFLPDDLLVKLDVATMAHGLEARCPFLDRALLDFAFRIPAAWKIKGMRTKVICRDAFAHLLPRAIVRAPKRGFELPVDAWLRGPLYHHARDTILSSAALRAQFNARALERMLLCHRRGARRHGHRIWMLMCFALWQERYIAGSG